MLVTVGPNNQTGFRKHLEELTCCIRPSKFIAVKDKGYTPVIKEIKLLKPSLTIIGGRNWILRNSSILNKLYGKKGILFCSPLAQAEISPDEIMNLSIYLKWLDKQKIDFLFVGSKELSERFSDSRIIYLPAPFIKDIKEYENKIYPNKNIVALLNDKATHKNILNSIASVSLSKKTDKFIVNGLPKNYITLANRFGLKKKLENVGFLPKSRYYEVIKRAKLSLNLSFSEGFSYYALECLYSGTPVLLSNTMPWFYHKSLSIDNLSDHKEIADKLDEILGFSPKKYGRLNKQCRDIAEKTITNNNKIAKRVLEQVLY